MRRLSLFAIIFIVMAGLYWFLEGPKIKDADQGPNHLLSNFSPADVHRINITSSDSDPIVLQKTDGEWQVETGQGASYAADSSAIQELIESLTELKTNSMVSRKPDRHALYEVSPETGLQVETLDHKQRTLAEVLIGKSGPNIFSTYVRAADKNEVYLVDGILQNKISKTLNEWRDKRIFALDPNLITTFTVSGDQSLVLNKTDGKWLIGPEAAPANTATVEQAVQTLATLNAVDFADGTLAEYGFDQPLRTITAVFNDGKQATLLLGKDANAFQQYAKRADTDTLYIIEKHVVSMLCPTRAELNSAESEEKAPSATSR